MKIKSNVKAGICPNGSAHCVQAPDPSTMRRKNAMPDNACACKGRGTETQRPAWERINTRAGLASTIARAIGRCANQFYCPGSIFEKEQTRKKRDGRADLEINQRALTSTTA